MPLGTIDPVGSIEVTGVSNGGAVAIGIEPDKVNTGTAVAVDSPVMLLPVGVDGDTLAELGIGIPWD